MSNSLQLYELHYARLSHVRHYLLEFAHTHVHWVGDAIQQSDPLPLSSPFSPYK